jgi:hypothetical protein
MNQAPGFGQEKERPQARILGFLKGGTVVRDRFSSHLHQQGNIEQLLSEAVGTIEPNDRSFIVESVDFEHQIGVSNCVSTTQEDSIIFAQRKGRGGLTRFALNRNPEPTSHLSFGLKRDEDGGKPQYICMFAFIGPKAEPEPWDKNMSPESKVFWQTHALAWGSEPVIPGTETSESPEEFK